MAATPAPLAELLLASLPDALRERIGAIDVLGPRLESLLDKSRAAWPELAIEPAVFLRHLAERMTHEDDPVAFLQAVHAADLYLACGCSRGDPAALRAFERHYLSRIARHLSARDALPSFSDEVRQALRSRLLVAEPGVVPKIVSYSGRAPLAAWLAMVVTRTAVDLRRQEKKHLPVDGAGSELRSGLPDPELELLKESARAEFEDAFRKTLASLTSREANVIRLYFLDGLTQDAIASLFRVHTRTVQRWIVSVRDKVSIETRRLLSARMSESEIDSVLRIVQSEFHLTMRRILPETPIARPD